MQSKKIAVAGSGPDGPASRALPASERTKCSCARRRAARRLEIDRDHRLLTRGLVREVSRLLLANDADGHPEGLIERLEAALAASRADCLRLNNTRIALRGHRDAHFEDSVPLPVALAVYRHRGNYHGVVASMDALGSLLGHLVARPDGAAERGTAVSLAEELHRCCEIWTLELGGAVHVFARPGSEADRALADEASRQPRALSWARRTALTVV